MVAVSPWAHDVGAISELILDGPQLAQALLHLPVQLHKPEKHAFYKLAVVNLHVSKLMGESPSDEI